MSYYFDKDRKLSEEGLSLCVEAILLNKTSTLPEDLQEFLDTNLEAKLQVLELCELMRLFESDSSDSTVNQPETLRINQPKASTSKIIEMETPPQKSKFKLYGVAAAIALFAISAGILVFTLQNANEDKENPVIETELTATTTQPSPISGITSDDGSSPKETTVNKTAEQNKAQENKAGSLKSDSEAKRLAQADTKATPNEDPYTPLETHELYLLSSVRSGGDIAFRLISPSLDQTCKGSVNFNWEIKKQNKVTAIPLQLEIRNNKNKVVLDTIINGSSLALSNKLKPGLYYWFLNHEEESLYMGKFKYYP